jgi:hypothetical protein
VSFVSRPRARAPRLSRRSSRRRKRLGLAAGLAVLAAILAHPAAAQQQGVAIDLGRIDVDEELTQGERYQLPTLGVRNPGTAASEYHMTIQPVAGTDAPAATWFSFSPTSFGLEPDARQPVEVALEIPADAAGGDYAALIAVEVAPDGEGARVGAAAASRLTFSISATAVADAPPAPRPRDTARLPWLVILLILLLALLIWVWRRYDLRIVRRT